MFCSQIIRSPILEWTLSLGNTLLYQMRMYAYRKSIELTLIRWRRRETKVQDNKLLGLDIASSVLSP